MDINWGNLSPAVFFQQYWQKKPLLIKNAIENFRDPISADELAGLAMEEHIESRIISQNVEERWQVAHGPFDDFSAFGKKNWTLLVQAVNHWSRPTNNLLELVNFIPQWRIDDVMVSFSTPNGGVGPHLDQYDVFIIQGHGKRHWQVGLPDSSLKSLCPHPDLKQVSDFSACIDVVTEPGDLLYIPPNHPHNGTSIENSLNYSIGFQAPNAQEVISSFADEVIDNNLAEQRFSDSNRVASESCEELSAQDLTQLKDFLLSQLTSELNLDSFLSRYLTKSHHGLELLIPVEPITPQQLSDIVSEPELVIIPVSGLKALYINKDESHFDTDQLVINGETIYLTSDTEPLGRAFAQKAIFTAEQLKKFIECKQCQTLVLSMLNKGYWYVD